MLKLQLNFDALTLLTPLTVQVYAPSLNVDLLTLPCVFCLHPAFADGSIFVDKLGLLTCLDAYPAIYVIPSLGNNYFVNQSAGAFFDFLDLELLPLIGRTLRVNTAPENIRLLGISMGAFGALHWTLAGRAPCAKVALLSGFYDPKFSEVKSSSRRFRLIYQLMAPSMERSLQLASGKRFAWEELIASSDRQAATDLLLAWGNADTAAAQQSMHMQQLLSQAGFRLQCLTIPGDHDSCCWQQLLPQALRFLLT